MNQLVGWALYAVKWSVVYLVLHGTLGRAAPRAAHAMGKAVTVMLKHAARAVLTETLPAGGLIEERHAGDVVWSVCKPSTAAKRRWRRLGRPADDRP